MEPVGTSEMMCPPDRVTTRRSKWRTSSCSWVTVLGYNLKVAVGTSTMIMTLVALTGAVSHISLGARIFPLLMAVVVLSCLLGAVVSAKFANRCEIARLNRIVGIVLVLLGIVTITVKLL